jgi:hypothetical protein
MTSESDSSSLSTCPIVGEENTGELTLGKGLSGLISMSPSNIGIGEGGGEGDAEDNGENGRRIYKSRGNGPAFRLDGLKGIGLGDSEGRLAPRPPLCAELPPTRSISASSTIIRYKITIKNKNKTIRDHLNIKCINIFNKNYCE